MTRVIGLLSWWDESEAWLTSTITSMGRICEHLIAVDGRYALYPGERTQGATSEGYAIQDAARAAGMGLTLYTAPRTWRDEMDKRTHLFRLGMLEARAFEDWFFILDGDEVLIESPDRAAIRVMLDAARADGSDVVTATLWEKTDPAADEQREQLSRNMPVAYTYETPTPRFWRALRDLRVEGYHFNYLGENEDGDTVEMWGSDTVVDTRARWTRGDSLVVIENRNRLRGQVRDAARQQYYRDRDDTGLETIAPLERLKEAQHA
jgi:hypothetical protein